MCYFFHNYFQVCIWCVPFPILLSLVSHIYATYLVPHFDVALRIFPTHRMHKISILAKASKILYKGAFGV